MILALALSFSLAANPFNGIERCFELADLGFSLLDGNPFNGIEREAGEEDFEENLVEDMESIQWN